MLWLRSERFCLSGTPCTIHCMNDAKIVRKREEGERKTIPDGEPRIVAEGRLGAIVEYPMLVDQGHGYEERVYENFVRPPGTRIIALRENTIYLQKEYRSEVKEFDWRLPGGKVLDSFSEYKKYIGKEVLEDLIIEAGRRELREEAKLEAKSVELFKKSSCGASVIWDLYYLIAKDLTEVIHDHDEGEEIIEGKWLTYDEVLTMIRKGEIGEDRTVAALLQFIASQESTG